MAEPALTFPEWLEPMAATLTQERFDGPQWTFERKLDGIRLLAFKDGQQVRLLSRNKLAQNAAYPSIVEAVAHLPVHNVILDGEATGEWGVHGAVAYHVFDVLWLDGRTSPRSQSRSDAHSWANCHFVGPWSTCRCWTRTSPGSEPAGMAGRV